MHTETEITAWLEPLFEAAEHTDIDLWAIVQQATVAVAQVPDPEHRSDVEARLAEWPDLPAAAVDWVKMGQLLRHKLGWDDSYPEHPLGG
jgi:hypothetical protein